MNFESLFLQTPDLTDEQNVMRMQMSAALASNMMLKETFQTSIKCRVVDALSLLEQRKFEEAYAALIGAESVQEIQQLFEDSKTQIEQNQKQAAEVPQDTGNIKY